jgi:structural maintenance of chromosome 2
LALELVGYDAEVRKAMEYAFGGAIVCDSSDAAKEIMQSTRTKAVTLEGDVFDPAGTMSGGAKSQIGTLLSKISDLAAAKATLNAQVHPDPDPPDERMSNPWPCFVSVHSQHACACVARVHVNQSKELSSAEAVLSRLESQGAAAKDLETDLELKRHALKMAEEKLADSDYAQKVPCRAPYIPCVGPCACRGCAHVTCSFYRCGWIVCVWWGRRTRLPRWRRRSRRWRRRPWRSR